MTLVKKLVVVAHVETLVVLQDILVNAKRKKKERLRLFPG